MLSNTSVLKKRLQPLTLEWLDQQLPNFFERGPNLSLVNTSRPMPQTTYEKASVVWMFFCSKLLISFLGSPIQESTVFSSVYATHRRRQAVVTLEMQLIHNPGLDPGLCVTDPFFDPSLGFDVAARVYALRNCSTHSASTIHLVFRSAYCFALILNFAWTRRIDNVYSLPETFYTKINIKHLFDFVWEALQWQKLGSVSACSHDVAIAKCRKGCGLSIKHTKSRTRLWAVSQTLRRLCLTSKWWF